MPFRSVRCPNCFYSEEVDEIHIPPRTRAARCRTCGHEFAFSPGFEMEIPQTPSGASGPPVTGVPLTTSIPRPTPPASPPIKKTARLNFHGDGRTLFGLMLVNVLLTIITLGIYKFWGKAKVRNYLYGQTEFVGDRFAYHGNGKELFIGWLKAMIIIFLLFGAVNALSLFNPLFALIFLPVLPLFISFAMIGAMKYRLSRTTWRGIRFSFRGEYKEGIILFIKGWLLTIFTIGIYYPFFQVSMRDYWTNNAHFGNIRFGYNGKGRDLLKHHILAMILGIFTFGIYWIWYRARTERYHWEHTTFRGISFKSTVTGGKLLSLYLTNFLLLIFTLGLAYPWIIIRSLNFRHSNISLTGDLQFDQIIQDSKASSSFAEGLADYMDIDGGFIDIGSVF